MSSPKKYTLVVFDLDNTLTESRQKMDEEMVSLFAQLVNRYYVGIISGSAFSQIQEQVLDVLSDTTSRNRLLICPTNGTELYVYRNDAWVPVYQNNFSEEEKENIIAALREVVGAEGLIEDRGSQITFAGLPHERDYEEKKHWDPDHAKRNDIVQKLTIRLPELEIRIGGTTSIDITKKGINKSTAFATLLAQTGCTKEQAIFVGDALFPGGNDSSVKDAGYQTVMVDDVGATKRFIQSLLSS